MASDARAHSDPVRERTVILNQLLLAAIVLFAGALTLVTGQYRQLEPLIAGVTGIFITSVTAVIVRWDRLPALASALIPVADIVSITLLQVAQPLAGLSLLWIFPILWAALSFGAVVTAVLTGAAVTAYWILLALSIGHFEIRAALVPLTLISLAVFGQVISRRANAQRTLLARQARTLQGAFARARTQEALVNGVLQTVDFGVLRVADDGRIAVTNEAHARLLGDPDAPLFRADGVTPLTPEERPLARARRGETFDGLELWHGAMGSGRRALHVSARHVKADGESGIVVVSRDATAERTALRARDDLVASVSHELRTPLTSIMGYLDLALDDPELPDSARRSLEVAERNAQRLLVMVNDMLTAGAATAPGSEAVPPLRAAAMDVRAVVLQAVEAALPRAQERGIVIDTSGAEAATAHADAVRVRQIVDNLLSNAVKYSHARGRVWIGCATEGRQAVIAVRDEGPGISAAEQPRLFERFFRADEVRRSSTHGSGLGLAISRDIARAHGGDIRVQSTPGQGATFIVTLPADGDAAGGDAAQGPEENR